MDTSFLLDVLALSIRWLHLIFGIAWIGSSFYFVWLDNSIRPPEDEELKEKGVLGELWAMHAGGFYNPQKYVVAPKKLPEKLHWFFWPSYTTWITGFLLISTLYYFQASTYMIDPNKTPLSPLAAVAIGLGTLVGGWLVYDFLCRLLIDKSQMLFAAIYTVFVAIVSYVLNHVLSGRAAYIHVGAMIATAMSGNVFFVIIPAQRVIVSAMKKGETPDAAPGKRAKQRSVHNNYLTMPVLFAMISNHYAFTYNNPQGWQILIWIMIGSAVVRHFFNLKHKDKWRWEYLIGGTAIIFTVFLCIMPWRQSEASPVLADVPLPPPMVQGIIASRCTPCHSMTPVRVTAAPAGVMFDTPEQMRQQSKRIYQQAVKLKAMPIGNVTGITEEERHILAEWLTVAPAITTQPTSVSAATKEN